MTLYGAARMMMRVSSMRHPTRYAKNRVKSRALRQVGFWRLWGRWWRA